MKDKHIQGPPFGCSQCEFKTDKLDDVLAHNSEHKQEEQLKNVEESQLETLLPHTPKKLNCEQAKATNKFVCDICEKSFGHRQTLIQHQALKMQDSDGTVIPGYPPCGERQHLLSSRNQTPDLGILTSD